MLYRSELRTCLIVIVAVAEAISTSITTGSLTWRDSSMSFAVEGEDLIAVEDISELDHQTELGELIMSVSAWASIQYRTQSLWSRVCTMGKHDGNYEPLYRAVQSLDLILARLSDSNLWIHGFMICAVY